ncbi:MAG: hypothetical protein WA450_23975, partial [Candidatus Acidiferrales bacterium]
MREGHADIFFGLLDAIYRVAENGFDLAGKGMEDNRGEFAARKADVAAVGHARKCINCKHGHALADGIDGADLAEHDAFA